MKKLIELLPIVILGLLVVGIGGYMQLVPSTSPGDSAAVTAPVNQTVNGQDAGALAYVISQHSPELSQEAKIAISQDYNGAPLDQVPTEHVVRAASLSCLDTALEEERGCIIDFGDGSDIAVSEEHASEVYSVFERLNIVPVAGTYTATNIFCTVSDSRAQATGGLVLEGFECSIANVSIEKTATVLPGTVGSCTTTTIAAIHTRLEDETGNPIPDSGYGIGYANAGVQVSYEDVPGIETARVGDKVLMCLISVPEGCPPGDERGKVYTVTNMRTETSWTLPDSGHSCGGA